MRAFRTVRQALRTKRKHSIQRTAECVHYVAAVEQLPEHPRPHIPMRAFRTVSQELRTKPRPKLNRHTSRVGQNRTYAPYLTVHLVIPLRKILYVHRIYMILANPTYKQLLVQSRSSK
jgi:hypothetical protein